MQHTEHGGSLKSTVHRLLCKVPVQLVRFERNLSVLDEFSKNTQTSNFIQICPLGELFHADGQTDMTELAPKNR